ncbi:MAG: uracil-DNA glycosylase [Candidatus Zixiibacteriota bacterium]
MKKNSDINDLLRRAIASQVEMGLDELVLKNRLPETKNTVLMEKETVSEVSVKDIFNNRITMKMPSAQYDSVDSHYNAISNCQLCSLAGTRNKFVYGVGNSQADLLFIGEAPGADEDRLGEPFVGRAGQLLDRILAAIQLSRKEVYIANILKCRPPNNRDPLPDEMDKCFPYLYDQVRLIKPKLICALGRGAAQALLKTSTPLGKLRKQWHNFEGVPTLVTYHPAALLRFASYKKDTWEDMQMLKARLDSL